MDSEFTKSAYKRVEALAAGIGTVIPDDAELPLTWIPLLEAGLTQLQGLSAALAQANATIQSQQATIQNLNDRLTKYELANPLPPTPVI